MILPIVLDTLPKDLTEATQPASFFINRFLDDVANARNNLLLSKITQTHHTNQSQNADPIFPISDMYDDVINY